ncbi:MAG: hypothetical protein JO243_03740 [Solirubrobacterales bacterium]|nr:hypothetical protein [Solirubrobacterales bacterium]
MSESPPQQQERPGRAGETPPAPVWSPLIPATLPEDKVAVLAPIAGETLPG